ncbi:4-alpha-glucanotransferase, partial [Candidatus Parcubacteria bacterium]|nr:4-alpha-glucanotransferase [Candidatus Parcubacteria bacterium]
KIGTKKRAGVVLPLFFIWSKVGSGIGEILDLKEVIDWCQKVGFEILQLLPIYDSGFNTSPYNLQSGFALNPIYLSINNFCKKEVLKNLRKKFSQKKRVDFSIKKEKLKILWQFFKKNFKNSSSFEEFKEENKFWIEDFAVYRVLKEKFKEKSWESWPKNLKNISKSKLEKIKLKYKKEIEFQKWLQWQIFLQMKEIKKIAERKGVYLMGDFPWLISRDSADVWRRKEYFELEFEVGAPPDNFAKRGQRWGMPPLNWEKIFKENFEYLKQRLRYFQKFFHLARIDHVIGLFRTWKINHKEPLKNRAKNGFFEPKDEKEGEERGRQILISMIKNSDLLICAEDLGKVPPSCPKVLNELGIPGICVQRWMKNWQTNEFLDPKDYPLLSISTLSTHDTSNFLDWFESLENKEKEMFLKFLGEKKETEKTKILRKALEKVNLANSIFSINLILDWLFLFEIFEGRPSKYRINIPGRVSKLNWTLKSPISIEEISNHPKNKEIEKILKETKRK